jgi:hypothetical protein
VAQLTIQQKSALQMAIQNDIVNRELTIIYIFNKKYFEQEVPLSGEVDEGRCRWVVYDSI